MAASPPVLTLEAVNALVPRLNALMASQMDRRSEIERRLEQLSKLLGGVPDSIDVEEGDPAPVRELKLDLVERVERYQSAWNEVEEMGAVLKDPRTGLVDFYGLMDGKLVWLCWKYGEDGVSHYHGLDEGFSGRKPIQAAARHRHLN
ncbi:MAG: DUF2203 domain-containing protein [Polyangiaceae bacterium]